MKWLSYSSYKGKFGFRLPVLVSMNYKIINYSSKKNKILFFLIYKFIE